MIVPKKPTKIVVTLHDVLPLEIPGFLTCERDIEAFKAKTQRDLDNADLVFTASQHSREMIIKTFQLSREPILAPYASTLSQSDISTGGVQVEHAPESFFLYVGGYHSRKGIEQLVETHRELFTSKRIHRKLILVGRVHHYSAEIARLIDSAMECGSLVQLGYVTDLQLVWLFRRARALVYPSLYEGFGLPVLEAMQVGCPVLTTKGTSLPEICDSAALIVDPSNKTEFGQALIELDRNDSLRSDLIAKGHRRASLYSWGRSAGLFLENVLGRPRILARSHEMDHR
ncbi:MAG: glycosyltransferase family 4 protein [Planctomycetes bacterium]|nr:glycosyltransferase family 4 protein [Planctomycetota bacterium]